MQTADERNIFLSTLPATSRDRRAALAVVGVSAVLFVVRRAVYASVPLAPVPAFIASYQSALAINDLITAILLFSQFAILRSRALLLLASGYLFTAAAAIVHALTFPACLRRPGCSTPARRPPPGFTMIWHIGFPLLVLGYALLKDKDGGPQDTGIDRSGRSWAASLRSRLRWPLPPGSSPPDTTCCRS